MRKGSTIPIADFKQPFPPLGQQPRIVPGHFLQDLLNASLVVPEDWEKLPPEIQNELSVDKDVVELLATLLKHGLVTEYQAARIYAGKTDGLIVGNYRILDRLGSGSTGVVFKAEHLELRHPVAVKILAQSIEQDSRMRSRFLTEMRTAAQLQHPNVVTAMDAGTVTCADPDTPTLRYFVMEFVPGRDLDEYVTTSGPLALVNACDIIYQVASALAEANKRHLVHRDIKPANIRVTPDGQAKLLDFGLARDYSRRITQPGVVLGTLDYMAPEQARDSASVDIRADIFALGGVLYWCLTGRRPFEASSGTFSEQVFNRLSELPPSIRQVRPELPAQIDRVVCRMMALTPEERFATPEAVMAAVVAFLKPEMPELTLPADHGSWFEKTAETRSEKPDKAHVLIVDDEESIRSLSRFALEAQGFSCREASSAEEALQLVPSVACDLLLVDVNLPHMSGPELCRRLREKPPSPHLKIVMVSGQTNPDEMARMLLTGADDYLPKPFSPIQLQSRVAALLRLREAQVRAGQLYGHLLHVNQQLEKDLSARPHTLMEARDALVLCLSMVGELREDASGTHVRRIPQYCRTLAEEAASARALAGKIDADFVQQLECCAPLHDVGKAGLPDHIILKPGKLDPDERCLMQTHATLGAELLRRMININPAGLGFLEMAADIARYHHERYDGSGYPDKLAGANIPLPARLVTVADVYDALRSKRAYKPPLSHSAAVQVMQDTAGAQFDPALLQAFVRCADKFEQIYRSEAD